MEAPVHVHVRQAHGSGPSGLAGIVHDLSVPTLVAAYSRGLFPFSHVQPLKWWSPPTRTVLLFRSSEYYAGEHPDEDNAAYVLFCRSLPGIPVDCSDDLDELIGGMASMRVTVESHLYEAALSWAPALPN